MGNSIVGYIVGGLSGGAVGIVIGILVGALLGMNFGSQAYMYAIVPEHQTIIDNLSITESANGGTFTLSAKCVDGGERVYGEGLPQSVFRSGVKYKQSTWLYQRYGDTDLCLTIWGPDDNGTAYNLEAGSLASSATFSFTYEGVALGTMSPEKGYWTYDLGFD